MGQADSTCINKDKSYNVRDVRHRLARLLVIGFVLGIAATYVSLGPVWSFLMLYCSCGI